MAVATEVKVKNGLIAITLVLLAISCVFFIKGYFAGHFSSVEVFRAYVESYGIFAPIVLTFIQMLQVVLPILPGIIGCAVGVGMFGAVGGFWCNYIGISAGSIVAFFLAKWLGVNLVKLMVSEKKYNTCVAWIQRRKYFTVLFLLSILLPLAPDDFLCYFSGLIGMENKKFIWIILLCKPWLIIAYSILFGYFW